MYTVLISPEELEGGGYTSTIACARMKFILGCVYSYLLNNSISVVVNKSLNLENAEILLFDFVDNNDDDNNNGYLFFPIMYILHVIPLKGLDSFFYPNGIHKVPTTFFYPFRNGHCKIRYYFISESFPHYQILQIV